MRPTLSSLSRKSRVASALRSQGVDPIPAAEGRAVRREERLVQRRFLQLRLFVPTNRRDARLLFDVNHCRVARLVFLDDSIHPVLDRLPSFLRSLYHKRACCTRSSCDLLGELALPHFVSSVDGFPPDLGSSSMIEILQPPWISYLPWKLPISVCSTLAANTIPRFWLHSWWSLQYSFPVGDVKRQSGTSHFPSSTWRRSIVGVVSLRLLLSLIVILIFSPFSNP